MNELDKYIDIKLHLYENISHWKSRDMSWVEMRWNEMRWDEIDLVNPLDSEQSEQWFVCLNEEFLILQTETEFPKWFEMSILIFSKIERWFEMIFIDKFQWIVFENIDIHFTSPHLTSTNFTESVTASTSLYNQNFEFWFLSLWNIDASRDIQKMIFIRQSKWLFVNSIKTIWILIFILRFEYNHS
jgi:hypothetical protein